MSFDNLTALKIRHSDHTTFGDISVHKKGSLDLRTSDVVAGRKNDVVRACGKMKSPFNVAHESVTREIPALSYVLSLTRAVQVSAACRPTNGQTARRSVRRLIHIFIDDLGYIACHRPPSGAGVSKTIGDEDV